MTPTPSATLPQLKRVIGVDFSGAAKSGKTAWLAALNRDRSPGPCGSPTDGLSSSHEGGGPLWRLVELAPIGRLAGSDERDAVNRYLVDRILSSRQTLWGMDFRRDTDRETQTPFDCYHYRIIYQTFHGMRDVLRPIVADPRTAVLPFQYDLLGDQDVDRVVVEACPSSTLKRLGLPHRLYKQSGAKPPDGKHRRNRQIILRRLANWVQISDHRRRVMMRDPGGDALDAVIAAVGAWRSVSRDRHAEIAEHPRYRHEGRVYCEPSRPIEPDA